MNKFILILLACALAYSLSISAETVNSIDQPLSNQAKTAISQSINQVVGFKYPPLTQEQIHLFCNQMYAQVQANEQTIKKHATTIQDSNEKDEFVFEMKMEINMQKYLISVIKDQPEIISPRVRQAFMYRLRQNFFPNFDPEIIATQSLATTYFLGRIMEAERPYVLP